MKRQVEPLASRPLRAPRSRGQSMVEYLVASAVLLSIVALPFGDSPSVVQLMLRAIRTAFARYLGAMSLPL